MKCHQRTKNFIVVMLLSSGLYGLQVSAQQNTNSLYSQTSEMADAMIQYDADKASILRFYSTASQGDFFNISRYSSINSSNRFLLSGVLYPGPCCLPANSPCELVE